MLASLPLLCISLKNERGMTILCTLYLGYWCVHVHVHVHVVLYMYVCMADVCGQIDKPDVIAL